MKYEGPFVSANWRKTSKGRARIALTRIVRDKLRASKQTTKSSEISPQDKPTETIVDPKSNIE